MADTKISALTAVATPAGTDEFPVNQAGASKKMTLAQVKTHPFPAGSATAGTWPKLTSGTIQTTPDVGSIELDANAVYLTTDAGNRGYVPVRHIIRADIAYTLTSSVAEQKLFNSPANGRLTLELGTYLFESLLYLTAMSATSGNAAFDPIGAGTAVAGTFLYHTGGVDNAAATAAAQTGVTTILQQTAASALVAATTTAATMNIKGTFEVTTAGTIIPSITLVTASAAIVAAGSYFMCERIGSTTMVSIGQWD